MSMVMDTRTCSRATCVNVLAEDSDVLCDDHLTAHRRRNRAYYQRTIDEGRQRSIDALNAERVAVRDAQVAMVRAWAARHGHVPTLRTIGEMFGYASPGQSASAQIVRGLAFGIRKFKSHENSTQIPYPVPHEWLA